MTPSLQHLKKLYFDVLLLTFAIFLIGGNFFRFYSFSSSRNSLSVVELFLYGLSMPYYFSSLKKSQYLLGLIFLSHLYGIFLHEATLVSLLYTLKLIAMIASAVAIGSALFYKYSLSVEEGLNYFIKVFFLQMLLGGFIYVLFPYSPLLFSRLQAIGITFLGDAHQNRFISSLFDPNYYSAIASFPFILSLYSIKKRALRHILSTLFALSIALTWSRSGIVTFLLVIFFLSLRKFLKNTFFIKKLGWILFYILGGAVAFTLYFEEICYFVSRFTSVFDDPSAISRLDSFKLGKKLFFEHPLLGTGYHFSKEIVSEHSPFLELDSSFLITLVDFGLVPTLAGILFSIVWIVNWRQRHDLLKNTHPLLSQAFPPLCFYLVIVCLFTCQFNNLLYYQFWLLPVVALFTYLNKCQNLLEYLSLKLSK